jgi:hypothetical protein
LLGYTLQRAEAVQINTIQLTNSRIDVTGHRQIDPVDPQMRTGHLSRMALPTTPVRLSGKLVLGSQNFGKRSYKGGK